MDHSKTIELTIPEGKAVKITCGGVTLWMMQSGRIPSEYQEVEWIAAAANVGAYINLGFAYDTAATIYLDQWLNGTATTTYPFGAANSTGVLRCMLTSPDGSSAHTSAFYGSNGVNYGASSVSNNVTKGKNEFVMTIGANVRKLQNRTTGVTSSGAASQTAYTMTDNLYLFAQNYKGSPRFGGERKISAFKYYDKSNALKCDLVPCYRKADGVIGMYDIARATFLTNVGSGSFTKGADVPTSGGIPEYHFIESARLVDTIRTFKATHPNSLIFGAVSDIHVYNANTTYEARSKTAIKNAAFALEMVGAMAECDFIANLGDNCWENGIDTENALLGAKYSINALKPAFDRLTSFNLVGNHDKSDHTEAQYNLIGVHNDFDVASSTVIRGFGYKDYTDKKVRVIVLNTCDYLNASGGCAMSYEQKDFLMRALDLTEIADKGCQILLLSHIPLDWNGGDYNFYADLQTILKAYENGTTASIIVNSSYALNETPSNYPTYTGGTLAYDYSGLNSAKIIANIHGHVHTNKVSKIANTNIARVATANTNPDLNKTESYPTYGDYSISTAEAAKIVKVSGTAKDTSATFYCIDLDEQTIYAYGYGADIDRTIIYKDDTPTYTNVIDTVGTEDNVRLRSGGATASAAGFASNYFPAKGGDIIRVSFPNGNRASIPSNGVYCCTYSDKNGTLVTAYDGSTSSTVLKNATDTGYEIHIPTSVNCSYARVAGGPNGAYSGWVVTVNEEIT